MCDILNKKGSFVLQIPNDYNLNLWIEPYVPGFATTEK